MPRAFDLIKEKVPLEDYFAKHLGADIVPDGPGRSAALCPFHGEDTPSLKISEDDGKPWSRWWCFGACQEGGTVIDAAMKAEGYSSPWDAADLLNELYGLGIDFDDPEWKAQKERRARTKKQIEAERAELADPQSRVAKRALDYLTKRGYSQEAIEHFELGAEADTPVGRLSIPIHDKAGVGVSVCHRALVDGNPCASCGEWVTAKDIHKARFQARKAAERGDTPIDWTACPNCGAADKQSKVKFLVTQYPKYDHEKGFDKASFLYHGYGARQALRDEGVAGLFLVEGPADVWAGWQSGHKAFCAYQGAVLSDKQAKEAIEMIHAAAGKKTGAERNAKPIILVPDTDKAGEQNVAENIRKLREVDPAIEIQVLHSVDRESYVDERTGDPMRCKDLGDVIKYHGAEKVHELLEDNRWSAAEWEIRKIINRRNPRTGKDFFSFEEQMRLVAEVLTNIQNKVALDHLTDELALHWKMKPELVQKWFRSELSSENIASYSHLFKTAADARMEAHEFAKEGHIMPLGYKRLDDALPGGGVRPGQLAQLLAKSGCGKTMLSTQLMMSWSEMGVRSIFFSLEQAAKSLYSRMVSQALDVDQDTATRYIEENDPELDKCDHIFRNILIIDNVPTADEPAMEMTPNAVRAIIQEANMTRFKDRPCDVVVVDHLLIMAVDDDAPGDIKKSETMAPGYIMQKLFEICKETEVFMLMLQQLPGHVKQGVAPSSDDGWGSSKQLMFCDYVLTAWRPELSPELDDTQKLEVNGQYKLMLAKNRYGANALAHLYFDKTSLRIIPALEVAQPLDSGDDNEGIIELDDDAPLIISADPDDAPAAATGADSEQSDTTTVAKSDPAKPKIAAPEGYEVLTVSNNEVMTEADVEAFVAHNPEPLPTDTRDLLLASLGAVDDEDAPQQGDPDALRWFED